MTSSYAVFHVYILYDAEIPHKKYFLNHSWCHFQVYKQNVGQIQVTLKLHQKGHKNADQNLFGAVSIEVIYIPFFAAIYISIINDAAKVLVFEWR